MSASVFGGRGCFWGAVLILSSVFKAPLSFGLVPLALFFFAEANGREGSFCLQSMTGNFQEGRMSHVLELLYTIFSFCNFKWGHLTNEINWLFFQSHSKDPDTQFTLK